MDRRAFFRRLMLRGLDRAEEAGQAVARRYEAVERKLLEGQSEGGQGEAGQGDGEKGEAGQGAAGGGGAAAAAAGRGEAGVRGEGVVTHVPGVSRLLRPPGAGEEKIFVETCTACGLCVEACPAHAIVLEPHQAGGRPYVLPAVQPCVMSSQVACTRACPSGALTVLESPAMIRMGKARVDVGRCLRTPSRTVSRSRGAVMAGGDDCRLCVDHCPAGAAAISIDETTDEVTVHDACTGCGVCENVCPTGPASIIVLPAGQR